jgi:hypothetical protein
VHPAAKAEIAGWIDKSTGKLKAPMTKTDPTGCLTIFGFPIGVSANYRILVKLNIIKFLPR